MHESLVCLFAATLVLSACRKQVESAAPAATTAGGAEAAAPKPGAPTGSTTGGSVADPGAEDGAPKAAPGGDGADAGGSTGEPEKPSDAPPPAPAAAGSGRKLLVLHLGCEYGEAVSDLEYAASGLRGYLKEKGIALTVAEKSKSCGCGLVWGPKKKYVEGAMTDVDLMYVVNDFFGIPNTE